MSTDPDALYLIWSNQKGQWWRPNRRGYTTIIEEAGRYSHDDAVHIVHDATVGWKLQHQRTNPVTGEEYVSYDEVLVLAPESTEVAW